MKRALLLLAVPLAGCMAGPDYARPELPVSPAWTAANAAPAARTSWWRGFRDPTLDALVAAALAGNLDLEAALARVETARAAVRGADAALLPAAEVDGTAARAQQSLNAGLGQLSRFVPDFPRTVYRAQLNVGGSWELDFAGGLRRRREIARADMAGRAAELEAVRLAISGEVADAYLALRGATAQREALATQLALLVDRRQIMAARLAAGTAPRSALDQSSAARDEVNALLAPLDAAVAAQRNRLAVLLGRVPGVALPELGAGGAVPDAPDPAAGVPADILRHRADVRAAEAQLIAANAGIGAALAEYYPKLSLSGLIGLDSNRFANLVEGDSAVVQGALGLRWRLFDFGRVDAEVRAARGRTREALAAYRATVLRASEEVETSFAQLSAMRARLGWLVARRAALAAAADATDKAFRAGAISRDAAVEARVPLAALDAAIAAARVDQARAVVACARALGGATAAE